MKASLLVRIIVREQKCSFKRNSYHTYDHISLKNVCEVIYINALLIINCHLTQDRRDDVSELSRVLLTDSLVDKW